MKQEEETLIEIYLSLHSELAIQRRHQILGQKNYTKPSVTLDRLIISKTKLKNQPQQLLKTETERWI